jgi:hypothetical protein
MMTYHCCKDFRFQLDLQGLLFGSQSPIEKEGDDDFGPKA